MIRTTHEAAVFDLWRDSAVLDTLVKAEHLTTASYEPVSRNGLGSGHVDLLFERNAQSCVISGLRLDPNSLITRERSPYIWPVRIARTLDGSRLVAIECALTPWLRSIARARPMARETIRRFTASERFDRAREAELLGAAPLKRVMMRMAPFVYARRFAAGSRMLIDCVDEALGHALLADLALSIVHGEGISFGDRGSDRGFARAWYGVHSPAEYSHGVSDVAVVDRRGHVGAPIIIETEYPSVGTGVIIAVPAPAPLDLLFTFDSADAPPIAHFSVHAKEPPLRPYAALNVPRVIGGSSGQIVLAMSPEALAMRGADTEEAETLKRCLCNEGLTVNIVTSTDDRRMADAELVHIFGGAFEAHTTAFGHAARERGVSFLFDVPPRPASPSAAVENLLVLALRAASDDAETARYLQAYEERGVTGGTVPEPSPEEHARLEARFSELASSAVAVLTAEEDVEGMRASLPGIAAGLVFARGVLGSPEPEPAPIGHLVPTAPFAFVHGLIAARSHALFVAYAAASRGVPLVIAGPCYDVEYLQTLRAIAPDAVVLADPAADVVSAIYRRATIWIDAAPRPRSAALLMRAVACGALPVLAFESPLVRIAGPGVPTFRLTSFEECAATIVEAMVMPERRERIAALQERLCPRRDLALTFGGLMAAYARVATPV